MDAIVYSHFNRKTDRDVLQGQSLTTLLQHTHIQPMTVMQRRKCVERTGGFDERLRRVDDTMRWILLAMEGVAFGYIDEALAMYRWRAGQFSNTRTYWQAFVTMFELLLSEKGLRSRCGEQAADVARNRLHIVRRDLAYLDHTEGKFVSARRQLLSLIRDWPFRTELYLNLLKSGVSRRLSMPSGMSRDHRAETRQAGSQIL
jgi:hypothetical protein